MTFRGHENRPRTPLSGPYDLCCSRFGRRRPAKGNNHNRKADGIRPSFICICHASLAKYGLSEPFAGGSARQSPDAGLSQ